MSVVKAPPRRPVYMLWGNYGSLGGVHVHPRGRLWVLADSAEIDAAVTARIAWNNRVTGMVEYLDLGDVYKATLRSNKSAEIHTEAGITTMVVAPCVCGAGAVGNALPDTGRISLSYVNPNGRPRITVL